MTKKGKNLIVLVSLVGILSLVYLFLSIEKKPDKDSPQPYVEMPGITDLTIADVDQMVLVHQNSHLTFTEGESSWIIKEGADVKTDSIQIQATLDEFLSAHTLSLFDDGPDLFEPGDDPVQITIQTKNDEEYEFLLGNATVTQEGYYLKDSQTDDTWLISRSIGDNLRKTLNDYRPRKLTPIDITGIQDISIEQGNQTIHIEPYSRIDMFTAQVYSYSLTAPYPYARPVNQSKMDKELQKVADPLLIKDFTDLSPEVLGVSPMKLSITDTRGKTLSLILGSQSPEGDIYAQVPGSDSIFILDKNRIPFLETKAFDLVDPYVYLVGIDSVTKAELFTKDATYTGIINGDKDNRQYLYNGQEIDREKFLIFYQNLISFQVEGEAQPEKVGKKAPYQIRYSLGGMAMNQGTVNFFEYDKNYYAVSRDKEKPLFLVGHYQLESVLSNIQSLSDSNMSSSEGGAN
ncbi:DUF4340 domain-containing protein [Spirochaeta cellobiosiphila]|uniref:DUF4340 domain-containing protein n=1 Tax=Spirochaeta cellobiosiphila TaxID=504483 RepID=UPI000427FF5B|nr:DUF4340 domain-containing protein [Spirochaeta cellobiosiphila]